MIICGPKKQCRLWLKVTIFYCYYFPLKSPIFTRFMIFTTIFFFYFLNFLCVDFWRSLFLRVVITPVGKRQPLSDNYSSHLIINRIEKRRKLGVIYLLQMTSTWKLHAFEHWDVEGLEKNWKLPIFCFLSQLQLISYPKKKVNFFLTRLKGGPMSLCCYVLRAG